MLIPSTRHARRTRAYKSTRYIPPPSSQRNPDQKAIDGPILVRHSRINRPPQWGDYCAAVLTRPTMFAVSTPASAIRPDRGTRSAVSWPKWSGTPASWFLASVSSSLICRALPSGWWRSIITVARRSSTSRKARTPSNWTRLSCRKFRNNAVRLQLHALAYNLGNFMRTLALPKEVEHWSMTTLRDKLVKIGAKVVRHGRYVTFQLAEVAVPRDLFRKILSLIDDLRRRPAPV